MLRASWSTCLRARATLGHLHLKVWPRPHVGALMCVTSHWRDRGANKLLPARTYQRQETGRTKGLCAPLLLLLSAPATTNPYHVVLAPPSRPPRRPPRRLAVLSFWNVLGGPGGGRWASAVHPTAVTLSSKRLRRCFPTPPSATRAAAFVSPATAVPPPTQQVNELRRATKCTQ